MAAIHVGDVGTRFQLTLRADDGAGPLDLVGATVLQLSFRKPSGKFVVKTATFSTDGRDGQIEWTTTATTDLDEVGPWQWQGHVTLSNDVEFHSEVLAFEAFGNLSGVIGTNVTGDSFPMSAHKIFLPAVTNVVETVTSHATTLYGYYIYNPNDVVVYVQLFDALTVTLGTTVPSLALGIPATGGANLMSDIGISFSTALQVAVTTTSGGNAAPSFGVDVNLYFA